MPLPPRLSPQDIASLLKHADEEASSAESDLHYAQQLLRDSGLTVQKSVLDASRFGHDLCAPSNNGGAPQPMYKELALAAVHARQQFNPLRGSLSAYPLVLYTTGGHSNVDHIVHQNPDGTTHKLSEYKRRMKQRIRKSQTEERGGDRWDLPRIPGGRRRRIQRDVDAPAAPPEPPHTGYVIYVSQMTTKLRHDNPKRHHDQISAIRRIAKMWARLSSEEKEHYVSLATDALAEYKSRLVEYRATGSYSPYTTIARLKNKNGIEIITDRKTGSQGPWVRIPHDRKNELEKELEGYDQVVFPPRPSEMEEEHRRKVEESKERRRRKIKSYKFRYY
jgi:hypothetical protein